MTWEFLIACAIAVAIAAAVFVWLFFGPDAAKHPEVYDQFREYVRAKLGRKRS